jgi:hypothetical protein
VLLLVAIEGLQHEEAAAILGVPLRAVRSRLSQGRQALRQGLGGGSRGAREPAAGAPHAGDQHLIGPCIAMSMARGRAARASGFAGTLARIAARR